MIDAIAARAELVIIVVVALVCIMAAIASGLRDVRGVFKR